MTTFRRIGAWILGLILLGMVANALLNAYAEHAMRRLAEGIGAVADSVSRRAESPEFQLPPGTDLVYNGRSIASLTRWVPMSVKVGDSRGPRLYLGEWGHGTEAEPARSDTSLVAVMTRNGTAQPSFSFRLIGAAGLPRGARKLGFLLLKPDQTGLPLFVVDSQ